MQETGKIRIEDVKIKESFAKSRPSKNKILKATKYLVENGEVDKPIVLDEENNLIDGYTRYLAAKSIFEELISYIKEKNFMMAYEVNHDAYNNYVEYNEEFSDIQNEIHRAAQLGKGLVIIRYDISQKMYSDLVYHGFRVTYILNPETYQVVTCIDWSDSNEWDDK